MNALIFANGTCRRNRTLSLLAKQADLIIAADGGANHCEKLRLTPDMLIGDLDSIDPGLLLRYEKSGMTIERHPQKKDATDLELALDLAVEQGFGKVHICGALGGRWDMSIANIVLCASRKYRSTSIILLGKDCTISILHPGTLHKIAGPPGKTVSLIPLRKEAKGVTLHGFEYPLEDAKIAFGSSLGLSNVLLAECGTVRLKSGVLALVVFSRPKT